MLFKNVWYETDSKELAKPNADGSDHVIPNRTAVGSHLMWRLSLLVYPVLLRSRERLSHLLPNYTAAGRVNRLPTA